MSLLSACQPSCLDNPRDPGSEYVKDFVPDLYVLSPRARRNVERVVRGIDGVERRPGAKVGDDRPYERDLRECVVCPLQKQRRSTSRRCVARSFESLPAGWSGNARNASPRTFGSGSRAWACEVMRPPNDRPTGTRASRGTRRAASVTTALTVACATGGGSGRFEPASLKGIRSGRSRCRDPLDRKPPMRRTDDSFRLLPHVPGRGRSEHHPGA